MKIAIKIAAVGALLLLASVFAGCCVMLGSSDVEAKQADASLREALRRHVEALCASPRHGQGLLPAKEYIIRQFQDAGWRVSLQTFVTEEGETYDNICASRPGRKAERYIIGAHYDACDIGSPHNPGADDNASGVAALLEIARRLPKDAPECAVELVAWACEEPPWFGTGDMGSARHASRYGAKQVRGMISLEMLGYFSSEPGSQPRLFPGHSLLLPTTGDFIAVVGDLGALSLARSVYAALRRELPAVRLNVPFARDTALYFSDHRNYAPRGIPAVMVTDTAMLRNPNYHEPSDTPDSLDYNSLALVTQGVVSAVKALAWP